MSLVFGAATSIAEVIESVDLTNFRVLVTGVSSGIGAEMAKVLARHGAHVIGSARDLEKARLVTGQKDNRLRGGGKLELIELDLASLASVRACAAKLVKEGEHLDVVIANAGVMASPEGRTVDGFETQFGTNYLGHFVLVNRIAGLLQAPARVIIVSSAGHRRADVNLDDPNFEQTPYDPLLAYRRSKTALILFALEFDRRHAAAGIRSTAVHPGAVLTETTRKMIEEQPAAASAFEWKTVEEGAATPVWAGFSAAANEIGGRYCEDCHVAEVNDNSAEGFGVRSYALNPARASALWAKSEELVKERF